MIKVLQIGMTDNLGGIERYLINYYRNIDREKVQFDFINIYENKIYFQEEIESLGGTVYQVSNYYKHPVKYIKEVKEIINKNHYKIVHCNMNSAVMIYPLIAGKISNAKIVISHSHNSSADKGIIKDLLHNINKRFIPLLANTFCACSEVAGKWFYSNKILESNHYYIIRNAIDMDEFKFDLATRKAKRKELEIEEKELVIGHVGRFEKQKNHEFLIDVFAKIKKQRKDVKLLLIGKGSLKEQIKEKVSRLGLEQDVIFTEAPHNKACEFYQAMDVFVLPSFFEGLPLVLIEAQSSGLPCFVSEIVSKEADISKNIQYISLDNIDKWCQEILNANIKRNKDNIENLSKKYNIKEAAQELEDLYLSI